MERDSGGRVGVRVGGVGESVRAESGGSGVERVVERMGE